LNIQPSAEDIHIMLIRARQAVITHEDTTKFDYAYGVFRTLTWLLANEKEPLTSETDWLPLP